MSTGNNIKTYTAADIEKYHSGLLSPKERHDLEKAALEDPFLADAIEGFATEGVNTGADIVELNKKLQAKIEGATVVPLSQTINQRLPVLRIAAILILLFGAGLLVYKFSFNRKEQEIAKVEPIQKNNPLAKDSSENPTENNPSSVLNTTTESASVPGKDSKKENDVAKIANDEQTESFIHKPDKIASTKTKEVVNSPSPELSAPVVPEKDEKEILSADQMKKNEVAVEKAGKKDKQNNSLAKMDKQAGNSQNLEGKTQKKGYNIFLGRVTDTDNRGIPFANVMNIDDKVATYTDANGYFNLTNPDSLLKVQVRSIGFQYDTVMLNYIGTNKIVMREDRKAISPYVINKAQTKPVQRNRDANQVFEEPEPADGWINYDAYMANNLKMPDDFEKKSLPDSKVELSFEINSLGEPVNIRIEKSLCTACDIEAIRLIKEGPKWKRNAQKKRRTTVSVNF